MKEIMGNANTSLIVILENESVCTIQQLYTTNMQHTCVTRKCVETTLKNIPYTYIIASFFKGVTCVGAWSSTALYISSAICVVAPWMCCANWVEHVGMWSMAKSESGFNFALTASK